MSRVGQLAPPWLPRQQRRWIDAHALSEMAMRREVVPDRQALIILIEKYTVAPGVGS